MVSAMTGDDDDIAIVDGDSASQNDGVVDQQGGDDNAIQELSNNGEERRGQDGGCDHQEILLDAEVELSPLQISRIPSSPVTRGRTSAQTSICGVPVAQAVHCDGEEDDFVESPHNTPTRNLSVEYGSSSSDRNFNVSASHLRYLGDDVVVAVAQTAHEDIMERGEATDVAGGDNRTRRSSSSGNGSHHEDSGGKCGRFHHITPRGRRMRCLCILGGIVLVILAVVGPVGHVMARRKKYSGSMDDAVRVGDAAPPTSHPTARPHSKEHELILQLLDPFLKGTGSIAHKIPTSPQYRAMEWIEATSLGSNEGFDLSPWINLAEGIAEPLPPGEGERLIQRYVLAVLYHSLGGDQPTTRGWTDNLNFLSHDVHECEWTSSSERPGSLGVICDENMRVVEINLGNNNLSGTLPQNELHGLTHLRKIDLSSNKIEGPLPEDLGQLSNLQALCMEDNSLTGTFPASYGQLTSLEELNLVDNELVGSIPSQVGRMTSLTNI